jgi:hypothetical protein
MKKTLLLLNNQDGMVLIMAVMFLALLTIIGLSASRTSVVEVQIANNTMEHVRTFYAAEAGLAHAIKMLEDPFVAHNADLVRAGQPANWDFALDGTYRAASDSVDTYDGDNVLWSGYDMYPPDGTPDGAVWIQDHDIDGISYTVRVWNNLDNGNAEVDNDGLIWIQSDAVAPRGGRASVRVLLSGNTTGESVTGYTAQAGAGAGKNYNANDLNEITTFNRQL